MKKWILTVGALGLATQVQAADSSAPVVKASVPNGTYAEAKNVTLTITDSSDKTPKLYYTTDKSLPGTNSPVYTAGKVFQVTDKGTGIDLRIRTLAVDKSGNKVRNTFQYSIEPKADKVKPVVTPSKAAGSYKGDQSITLAVSDNSDKAPKIYFTTDGSLPQKSSEYLYTAGTALVAKASEQKVDLRIRTLAVDASGNAVRNTFDYAIEAQSGGDTVAPQASPSPAAGTYSTAQQVTLSVTDETDKAPKLYYTLDGSAPQAVASSLYKAGTVLPISATTLVRTLSVDAAGNQRPQEFKFTISSDAQAPAVTASPDAGAYTTAQTVKLAVTDNKDTAPFLYYTTDGTEPQEVAGQIYKSGTPIAVSDLGKDVDMTIKTLAIDSSGNKATKSFSYSIGAQKEGYFKTNPNGQKGKVKTITIDGSGADWTEDMVIAQGVANDDPRIFRGSHEGPVYDLYSLSAAWDDTNVYLMWQFVNVTDVTDPAQTFPISDNGKPTGADIPQSIAFDIDPALGGDGTVATGKGVWGMKHKFANKEVDQMMLFSSKPGVGQPALFKLNPTTAMFDYGLTYIVGFKAGGIEFKLGDGFTGSKMYGIKKNGYEGYTPADLADMTKFTDLLATSHSKKQDTIYEMKIPMTALGITKQKLESDGFGVMVLTTFGEDTIGSLPYDPTTLDNATMPYAQDPSSSAEKSDGDSFTSKFARIGK